MNAKEECKLGKCLLACDVLPEVVLEAEDKLSLREVEMRQIESVKVFGKQQQQQPFNGL